MRVLPCSRTNQQSAEGGGGGDGDGDILGEAPGRFRVGVREGAVKLMTRVGVK